MFKLTFEGKREMCPDKTLKLDSMGHNSYDRKRKATAEEQPSNSWGETTPRGLGKYHVLPWISIPYRARQNIAPPISTIPSNDKTSSCKLNVLLINYLQNSTSPFPHKKKTKQNWPGCPEGSQSRRPLFPPQFIPLLPRGPSLPPLLNQYLSD